MSARRDYAPWTPEAETQLRAMAAQGATLRKMAAALGRSYGATSKRMVQLGLNTGGGEHRLWADEESRAASTLDWPTFHARYPERTFSAFQQGRRVFRQTLAVPNLDLKWYPQLVEKVEGDAVIVGCAHFPLTNPTMWGRAIAVGERFGIKRLILAGDAFTMDAFSAWLKLGQKLDYEFPAELESARKHLVAALRWYDEMVILPGNHIRNRIVRISNGHIRLAQVMDMVGLPGELRERINTTELDYLTLSSGGEEFLVTHFADYRKGNDGEVARLYAAKYRKHIIGANGHRTGWKQTTDVDALYGFEIGTIADPERMGYANETLTAYPRMTMSFASVIDGVVTLYGEGKPLTDWARLLCT